MRCNLWVLATYTGFWIAFTLFFIGCVVFGSVYAIILLVLWLFFIYKAYHFVYRIYPDRIIVFRHFRKIEIPSHQVQRIYVLEHDYGFMVSYTANEKLHKSPFFFGLNFYLADVLNSITGKYDIDIKSLNKIGIVTDGQKFRVK